MLYFLNQKPLFYNTIAINLPIIKNNSKLVILLSFWIKFKLNLKSGQANLKLL